MKLKANGSETSAATWLENAETGRRVSTMKPTETDWTHAQIIAHRFNSHDDLVAALVDASSLIAVARQHFPKSIRNSDRFKLENTCATINRALERAKHDQPRE